MASTVTALLADLDSGNTSSPSFATPTAPSGAAGTALIAIVGTAHFQGGHNISSLSFAGKTFTQAQDPSSNDIVNAWSNSDDERLWTVWIADGNGASGTSLSLSLVDTVGLTYLYLIEVTEVDYTNLIVKAYHDRTTHSGGDSGTAGSISWTFDAVGSADNPQIVAVMVNNQNETHVPGTGWTSLGSQNDNNPASSCDVSYDFNNTATGHSWDTSTIRWGCIGLELKHDAGSGNQYTDNGAATVDLGTATADANAGTDDGLGLIDAATGSADSVAATDNGDATIDLAAATTDANVSSDTGSGELTLSTVSDDDMVAIDGGSAPVELTTAAFDSNAIAENGSATVDLGTASSDNVARTYTDHGVGTLDLITASTDTTIRTDSGTATVDLGTDTLDSALIVEPAAATTDLTTAITETVTATDHGVGLVELTTDSSDAVSSITQYFDTGVGNIDLSAAAADTTAVTDTGSGTIDASTGSSDSASQSDTGTGLIDYTTASTDITASTDTGVGLIELTTDSSDIIHTATQYFDTGIGNIALGAASTDSTDHTDTGTALVAVTTASTDMNASTESGVAALTLTTGSSENQYGPRRAYNFDAYADEEDITTSKLGAGDQWDNVWRTGSATLKADSAWSPDGLRSGRAHSTGSLPDATAAEWHNLGMNKVGTSVKLRMSATPIGAPFRFVILTDVDDKVHFRAGIDSNGKLILEDANLTQVHISTTTIAPNTEYRIALLVKSHATEGFMEAKIYDSAGTLLETVGDQIPDENTNGTGGLTREVWMAKDVMPAGGYNAAPASQAQLISTLNGLESRINHALSHDWVTGFSMRLRWKDLVDIETNTAVLDRARTICDNNGKKLSIRIMAGKHSPASVIAGFETFNLNGYAAPMPYSTTDGSINTQFITALTDFYNPLADWCRANDVSLLHGSWFAGEWSELYFGPDTRINPPAMYGPDRWALAHQQLIDAFYNNVDLTGILIEFPASGNGPLQGDWYGQDDGAMTTVLATRLALRFGSQAGMGFNGWANDGIASPSYDANWIIAANTCDALGLFTQLQAIQPWPNVDPCLGTQGFIDAFGDSTAVPDGGAENVNVRADYVEVYLETFDAVTGCGPSFEDAAEAWVNRQMSPPTGMPSSASVGEGVIDRAKFFLPINTNTSLDLWLDTIELWVNAYPGFVGYFYSGVGLVDLSAASTDVAAFTDNGVAQLDLTTDSSDQVSGAAYYDHGEGRIELSTNSTDTQFGGTGQPSKLSQPYLAVGLGWDAQDNQARDLTAQQLVDAVALFKRGFHMEGHFFEEWLDTNGDPTQLPESSGYQNGSVVVQAGASNSNVTMLRERYSANLERKHPLNIAWVAVQENLGTGKSGRVLEFGLSGTSVEGEAVNVFITSDDGLAFTQPSQVTGKTTPEGLISDTNVWPVAPSTIVPWTGTRWNHSQDTADYVMPIRVEDEIIGIPVYNATSDGGSPNIRIVTADSPPRLKIAGAYRGMFGTAIVSHAAGAPVFFPMYVGTGDEVISLNGAPTQQTSGKSLRYCIDFWDTFSSVNGGVKQLADQFQRELMTMNRQVVVSSVSGSTFLTGAVHGLSVGDKVYLVGIDLPAGCTSWEQYNVATVPSTTSFTLTGVTLTDAVVNEVYVWVPNLLPDPVIPANTQKQSNEIWLDVSSNFDFNRGDAWGVDVGDADGYGAGSYKFNVAATDADWGATQAAKVDPIDAEMKARGYDGPNALTYAINSVKPQNSTTNPGGSQGRATFLNDQVYNQGGNREADNATIEFALQSNTEREWHIDLLIRVARAASNPITLWGKTVDVRGGAYGDGTISDFPLYLRALYTVALLATPSATAANPGIFARWQSSGKVDGIPNDREGHDLTYWDLGEPVDNPNVVADLASFNGAGTYKREFTKGVVLFNNTATSKTYTLPQNGYDVLTETNRDGVLTLTDSGQTITVPAYDGTLVLWPVAAPGNHYYDTGTGLVDLSSIGADGGILSESGVAFLELTTSSSDQSSGAYFDHGTAIIELTTETLDVVAVVDTGSGFIQLVTSTTDTVINTTGLFSDSFWTEFGVIGAAYYYDKGQGLISLSTEGYNSDAMLAHGAALLELTTSSSDEGGIQPVALTDDAQYAKAKVNLLTATAKISTVDNDPATVTVVEGPAKIRPVE